MQVKIEGNQCIVTREKGDRKYYRGGWGDGESQLLYAVKKILNARGYDLIKKRMWKDGHLWGDDTTQYLRTRKPSGNPLKDIYIFNDYWQIRGAEEDFNKEGRTVLAVTTDVFNKEV